MLVGVEVRVVTLPVFEEVADDFTVTAAAFVQLKQYNVPTVKSPLGKVTTWPVTLVAVAMLGHAVPPDGQAVLVVLTVKFAAVPSVYPVGNSTCTVASVAVVAGLAHTVPVVCVLIFMRSNRTSTCVRGAAFACTAVIAEITTLSARTVATSGRVMIVVFIFVFMTFLLSLASFFVDIYLYCALISQKSNSFLHYLVVSPVLPSVMDRNANVLTVVIMFVYP